MNVAKGVVTTGEKPKTYHNGEGGRLLLRCSSSRRADEEQLAAAAFHDRKNDGSAAAFVISATSLVVSGKLTADEDKALLAHKDNRALQTGYYLTAGFATQNAPMN